MFVTVTLQLSDADFQKLIEGKGNAQQMFMGGKLKIKGDVMKATKLVREPLSLFMSKLGLDRMIHFRIPTSRSNSISQGEDIISV